MLMTTYFPILMLSFSQFVVFQSALAAPQQVVYKTMNVGKLFALQYFQDEPFLLAAGMYNYYLHTYLNYALL